MGIFGRVKQNESLDYGALKFVIPVTPIEGSPNKVRGLDGWPDDAFPRQVRYQVQMLETALGLCRRGLAVAYLPKFLVRLHNQTVRPSFALHEMPLPSKLSKQRGLVLRSVEI
jgi:DNA-binding transcriptional LysR family regulator